MSSCPSTERLLESLRSLRKPEQSAAQSVKKAFSEQISARAAASLAEELRRCGLKETMPAPKSSTSRGAERRMAGGIGAKKVDVTWSTEESGLLLALSIKSIYFRDEKSKNYQKNLTNRRGDMLFEAVTLHRRFPYAVLGGFFFLDIGASQDSTSGRMSTFENAQRRFRIFSGRRDPAGRDEQYEAMYFLVHDSNPKHPSLLVYPVGEDTPITLTTALGRLFTLVAERNPDFYDSRDGKLVLV